MKPSYKKIKILHKDTSSHKSKFKLVAICDECHFRWKRI